MKRRQPATRRVAFDAAVEGLADELEGSALARASEFFGPDVDLCIYDYLVTPAAGGWGRATIRVWASARPVKRARSTSRRGPHGIGRSYELVGGNDAR